MTYNFMTLFIYVKYESYHISDIFSKMLKKVMKQKSVCHITTICNNAILANIFLFSEKSYGCLNSLNENIDQFLYSFIVKKEWYLCEEKKNLTGQILKNLVFKLL